MQPLRLAVLFVTIYHDAPAIVSPPSPPTRYKHKKSSHQPGGSFFMIFDDNRLRLYQILRRDALIVDYTADGLGKHVSHAELLHLMATLGVRDRVCEHDLLEC